MPSSAFKMAMPKFCGHTEMCYAGWSHTLKHDVSEKAAPALCLWICSIHLMQMCSQSACSWLSTDNRELPRAPWFREAGWWAHWHPWERQSVVGLCGAVKWGCARVCSQGGFLEKSPVFILRAVGYSSWGFNRGDGDQICISKVFCWQYGEWCVGVQGGSQGGGCHPPLVRGLSQIFLKCFPLSGPRGWRKVDGLRDTERTILTRLGFTGFGQREKSGSQSPPGVWLRGVGPGSVCSSR